MRRLLPLALTIVVAFGCSGQAHKKSEPDAAGCPVCQTCPAPKPFRMVVLGDRTGGFDDSVFLSVLKEAKRLSPDLIVSVGDLIEGYQPDDRMDDAIIEWDHIFDMVDQTLPNVPFFSTPGNHDVWSEKSEALFEKVVGHPVNVAFDAGSARVILFDTSRIETEADIPDPALDWLWHELYNARDRAFRIVITHRPLWAISPGGEVGSPLHDVLIAGQADWVLTGHWHHALADFRDGVRYRIIGPSGALENRPEHPESGNFQQFGLFVIDADNADLSLIRAGSVLPSDTIPYKLNQLEWGIENRAVRAVGFEFASLRPRHGGKLTLVVTNTTSQSMNSELSFVPQSYGWRVHPTSRPIKLKSGESKRLRFTYSRTKGAPIFPGPRLHLPFPWPGHKTYLLDTQVRPTLVNPVKRANQAPIIDGKLDDPVWKTASKLGQFPIAQRIGIPGETKVKLILSETVLYVGVKLEEPDMAGQSNTQPGTDMDTEKEDHILILLKTDLSAKPVVKIVVNASGNKTASTDKIRVAQTRDKESWSAEFAFPLDSLGMPTGRNRIGFNFARVRIRAHEYSKAYWQPLLDHDQTSFGILVLP